VLSSDGEAEEDPSIISRGADVGQMCQEEERGDDLIFDHEVFLLGDDQEEPRSSADMP